MIHLKIITDKEFRKLKKEYPNIKVYNELTKKEREDRLMILKKNILLEKK